MTRSKPPEEVMPLDLLSDGFEKHEVLHGFRDRLLPLSNERLAMTRFLAFAVELRRWKGSPARSHERAGWQLLAWPDLELLQAGRGIAVRIQAPWFSSWWNAPAT